MKVLTLGGIEQFVNANNMFNTIIQIRYERVADNCMLFVYVVSINLLNGLSHDWACKFVSF